jgi:hypothetical protein
MGTLSTLVTLVSAFSIGEIFSSKIGVTQNIHRLLQHCIKSFKVSKHLPGKQFIIPVQSLNEMLVVEIYQELTNQDVYVRRKAINCEAIILS